MIKLTILIAAFFLFSHNTFVLAQEQSNFGLGFHGAPAAAIFYGVPTLQKDFDVQYQFKLGFIAGITIQYSLSPKFALNSEVNFESKGNRVLIPNLTDENGTFIGTGKEELHADYLTVPMMVKYKFGQKKIKCFINAGPYLGYLLGFGWHVLPVGHFPGYKYEDDPDNYQRIDYGIVTGFGMNIPIKEQWLLSIEARNNLGLHKIIKGLSYKNEYSKNESVALLIGLIYKFPSGQQVNKENTK